MRHLTPEQVVDVADGVGTASSARHLRACTACQRQLTELRLATSMAAEVDVPEPSIAETIEILKGLKSRFAQHHGVKYSPAALVTAAELSARFINDRHLPDKAIDVIDEAGAVAQCGSPAADVRALNPRRCGRRGAERRRARCRGPIALAGRRSGRRPGLGGGLEAGLITQVGVDDDALSQLTSVERGELRRLLQESSRLAPRCLTAGKRSLWGERRSS
jgi:hypothetical protein